MIATALVAAVDDGHHFRLGRELAAWIGLVSRVNIRRAANLGLGGIANTTIAVRSG